MAIAGSEVVTEGTEGVFYCISRWVRRAFLCGEDPYSGRSYEHRREWIRGRLETLAAYFAIEVCGVAVRSNHVHLALRTRPDGVEAWDDRKSLSVGSRSFRRLARMCFQGTMGKPGRAF